MIRRIAERLRPRFGEIEQLHDELIPAPLRLLRQGHRWELTFDPSNMRAVATVGGSWDLEGPKTGTLESPAEGQPVSVRRLSLRHGAVAAPASSPAEAPDPVSEKALGIMGGAMEEARFLLGIVNAPPSSPVAAFASSLGLSTRLLVSCNVDDTKASKSLLGAIVCPLKFGSLGVDVL